jgi:hypothetical protein
MDVDSDEETEPETVAAEPISVPPSPVAPVSEGAQG